MILNTLQSKTISELVSELTMTELLLKSIEYGFLTGVQLALNIGANPAIYNNRAIRLASQYGHKEIVVLLLKDSRVNPSVMDNYAIHVASERGYKEVVELLLKDRRVDPSSDYNYAIQMASKRGYKEIVELLSTKGVKL